ncbi:hypothetical protein PENOC_064700 [Penicillium occitanis (nom. inval.)]|nr:hypothetical protein PENOC_064700 [Penicillium occitanis (nom. inval.)]
MPNRADRTNRRVKRPSCEPCRLSKLACNHAQPLTVATAEPETIGLEQTGSTLEPLIEQGVHILELVVGLVVHGTLRRVLLDCTERGLESHLGAFLVSSFVTTIELEVQRLDPNANLQSQFKALSRRLCITGTTPVDVVNVRTVGELANRYTGPNLRWEAIGVVLALMGNCITDMRTPGPVFATETECRALRKSLVDACGFQTWQRLNDAISAALTLGLHQRLDRDPEVPVFLVQLRKHIFARIYSLDISFAVFLGRPPRISKRMCMIHVPLDLHEEAYRVADGASMNEHLAELDGEGWNVKGEIRMLSVLRWSVKTSAIREEILEAMLGQDIKDRQHIIRNMRVQIENAWNELPVVLAVPPAEVWRRDRTEKEVDSLYMIRLIYLQAVFLVEWAATIHGIADIDALCIIAGDLLSWVNKALVRRDRLNKLGLRSLAWRVAACGLPSAGVLAKCLMTSSTEPSRHWHNRTVYSRLIQDLSMLLGHLEYLHEPGDANYNLFRQAKKVLTGVVEQLICYPWPVQTTMLLPQPCTAPFLSHGETFSLDDWPLNPDVLYEQMDPALFASHEVISDIC